MKLTRILQTWETDRNKQIIKQELEKIDPTLLPLQQGLSLSSYVSHSPFHVCILSISENQDSIIIKSGIFYTGIIAGCSCADDPTPQDEQNEYCEVLFTVNRSNAETTAVLVEE